MIFRQGARYVPPFEMPILSVFFFPLFRAFLADVTYPPTALVSDRALSVVNVETQGIRVDPSPRARRRCHLRIRTGLSQRGKCTPRARSSVDCCATKSLWCGSQHRTLSGAGHTIGRFEAVEILLLRFCCRLERVFFLTCDPIGDVFMLSSSGFPRHPTGDLLRGWRLRHLH